MSSLLAYSNFYRDPRGNTVTYTDVGTSFSSDQPLLNLSKPQLPLFVEFEETCELDADYGSSFSADVFAVLGHGLTDGMEVEFLDGVTSLGTVVVANYTGKAQHAILVLDTPVTLQVLTVAITGGVPSTDYRLGALWASASFREPMLSAGYDMAGKSLSVQGWAQGTGYAAQRPTYRHPSFEWPSLVQSDAIGPAFPNAEAILAQSGMHSEVIVLPSVDAPAHAVYGLITQAVGPICRAGNEGLWRAGASVRQQV